MPSTTWKQHKAMEARAHMGGPDVPGGIPLKVAKDFAKADNAAGITRTHDGEPRPGRKKRLPASAAVRGATLTQMRKGLA